MSHLVLIIKLFKMKFQFLTTLIFISYFNYGQENLCHKNILIDNQVSENNVINQYSKYDFSGLWTKTDNNFVYGIIGNNYQRIFIKFIFIEKNLNSPNEYLVYGKSKVKTEICNFIGKILIQKIQEFSNDNFGIDNEYKNKGIIKQGILTAKYEFLENKEQNHSGKFEGVLQTTWYLDSNKSLHYNDININSDSYFNNSFVGTWKMYSSSKEKICNWGDYRVPFTKCDFDIGSGEISISEKYLKNGWWVKPQNKWWQ